MERLKRLARIREHLTAEQVLYEVVRCLTEAEAREVFNHIDQILPVCTKKE